MIYQFYIIEIKRLANGEYEHNVQWAYDTDINLARRKAESIAHGLLKDAALSETLLHSVTVLTDEGHQVLNKVYHNIDSEEDEEEE